MVARKRSFARVVGPALDGEVVRRSVQAAAGVDLRAFALPRKASAWVLPEDTLRVMVSLVEQLKPSHILEFGVGLSTRVLAQAMARLEHTCRLSCVDHDAAYIRSAREELPGEFREGVRMQLAPLIVRQLGWRNLPLYDLRPEELSSSVPVDLALIDGPPETLGGREGTLYQLMSFARKGTIVVLDDANRESEQRAIQGWQDAFGDAIEAHRFTEFRKGLAIVIVREVIPPADIWSHQVRMALSQVRDLLPRPREVVLAGSDWWHEPLARDLGFGPFVEREGLDWGPPGDDKQAIAELTRLRRRRMRFLVFGTHSFWWLEHYREFSRFLRSHFLCFHEGPRLVIFDLKKKPKP